MGVLDSNFGCSLLLLVLLPSSFLLILRGLSSVIAGPLYFRAFPFVAGGILHCIIDSLPVLSLLVVFGILLVYPA